MSTGYQYKSSNVTKAIFARDGEDDAAKAAKEALDAQIAAAVEAAVSGLKAKNDELLGKLAKAKDDAKKFDGLDPEKLKEIQSRLDNDEDIKLFGEGKKNEVIYKYTERMRAEHDQQLQAEREKTAAEAKRADAYKGSVLDNQIRAATGGLHKGAVDDALLLARTIFSLDEKGNAVKLGSDGRPELGKDGQSPFSPAEWMELQKELKPHWFPSGTSGSGSGGAREAGTGTGKTIKRADFDKLSSADQATVCRTSTIID